ncbi:tetratricopeptide repeat protein [Peribacillus sp. NPDC058075]|uniref:tetratricopeptide repeat protein n=1 Tax=unclassified Peribacillus TaxID=2675266 RepID=UPI0036D89A65
MSRETLLSEEEAEKLYYEGNSYSASGKYKKAADIFKKVVQIKGTYFETGAYVNLAQCIWNPNPKDDQIQLEALNYIKKALEIKPTNQVALYIGSLIALFRRDYETCLKYFSQLDHPISQKYNEYNFDEWVYNELHRLSMENPAILSDNAHFLENIYDRDKKTHHELGHILIRIYASKQEFKKAYYIMDELSSFDVPVKLRIDDCINFSYECTFLLKSPLEGAKFAKQGLDSFFKMGTKSRKRNYDKLELLESNLAASYLMSDQYFEAIKLLEPKIKRNPSNTDYQNLSSAFYKLGKYDDAIKQINKALYISKDEMGFVLKGSIYYAKKQYEQALNYFLKAAAFIDEVDSPITFVEHNKKTLRSINLDIPFSRKSIYITLVNCYIALRQFSMAKAVLHEIKAKWPYEEQVIQLDRNIELFSEYELSDKETHTKLQELKKEINAQREKHQKDINKIQKWALELLKLQNKSSLDESNLLDDEKNWESFSIQMQHISDLMKSESNIKELGFQEVKNSLIQMFPNLSKKSLEFLSTGEYLFSLHSTSEIDFAPIIVSYSKSIEVELNRLLKRMEWGNKKELTLGQIKHQLEKGKLVGVSWLLGYLSEVINIRNGSAHTGTSTREVVIKVKSIIFQQGLLEKILSENIENTKN